MPAPIQNALRRPPWVRADLWSDGRPPKRALHQRAARETFKTARVEFGCHGDGDIVAGPPTSPEAGLARSARCATSRCRSRRRRRRPPLCQPRARRAVSSFCYPRGRRCPIGWHSVERDERRQRLTSERPLLQNERRRVALVPGGLTKPAAPESCAPGTRKRGALSISSSNRS